jgi:DNA-directed RNA polymerase specialized sigma24 family protein
MRRILIEHARRGKTLKHGGGRERRGLDSCEAVAAMGAPPEDLLALDEALTKLMKEDAVKGELVKLCYFGGLGLEEAAGVLGLSRTMAYRHWQYARAWLHDAITRGGK